MNYNSISIDSNQVPQGLSGHGLSSNTESLRVTGKANNEPVMIDHNLGMMLAENKENSDKIPSKY